MVHERTRYRIGVMGAGSCDADTYALARRVGEGIARAGAILLCGGLGGVMEASARGAREAGGSTIGILPGHRAADANPWIDIPVVTGMGHGRNVINVQTSEAIIAIGGGYGTLSEIALALKVSTPVVGLLTWAFERVGLAPSTLFHTASTPEDAVSTALALARAGRERL